LEFIHIDVCSPLCIVVSDGFQLHMLSPKIWVNVHLMRNKYEIFENVSKTFKMKWKIIVTRKINGLWFYHKEIYLSYKCKKKINEL